ncbi:unannotated protein [freshwater metagenome]|uniref:Unannotated protein n=1 Tax=freshwater metagenome TaxID=449393 RepID=A0A6J7MZF9_9ZZZZ|nr:hypothetical protein [Acidimicrobiia bacterium]MSV41322.1 hypothetical protein [Actinomycetota bacterium]MSV95212.1 hypothetical protein [Actinomycetota bacterium]MSW61456.1 hypothetical protein [Actinomycetota bacterium]MSY44140.1 hypothetical protein [Actinomycetota bacterium]
MLASSEFQWFYWIAPILVLSFLAIVAGLSMGYIRRVLVPRYRGKRVE